MPSSLERPHALPGISGESNSVPQVLDPSQLDTAAPFQWPALAPMDEDASRLNQILMAVLYALYRQTQHLHSQLQELQALGKELGYINAPFVTISTIAHTFCPADEKSPLARSVAALEVSPAADSLLSLLDQVFAAVHDFDDLPGHVNLDVLAQPDVQSFFQIGQGASRSTASSTQWSNTDDSRHTPPDVARQCSATIPEIECQKSNAVISTEQAPLFLQDDHLRQPSLTNDQRRSMAPSPDIMPNDTDELPQDLFTAFDRSMQVNTIDCVSAVQRVVSLLKMGLPPRHPLITSARVLSEEFLQVADAALQSLSHSEFAAPDQGHAEGGPRAACDEVLAETRQAAPWAAFNSCHSLDMFYDTAWYGYGQHDSDGISSAIGWEYFDWDEQENSF
ncbi:hypothetical protein H4R35_000613 [Dimargaris xerosporica]|nr:hypothetical protein H4R35_000613 [Dimargaris xerosporica]